MFMFTRACEGASTSQFAGATGPRIGNDFMVKRNESFLHTPRQPRVEKKMNHLILYLFLCYFLAPFKIELSGAVALVW